MAKKQATQATEQQPAPSAIFPLLYSFDAGNGSCKAVSTERREVIQFEPVMAPLTSKPGLDKADEKPTYSLKEDGQTLVFGIDDVYAHGKRASKRRLNAMERYNDPDYFRLIKVMYLQAFSAYRTRPEYITPSGAISLPVTVYQNSEMVDHIRNELVGQHELIDFESCALRIDIQARRLLIVPESYGALMHATYDPVTLQRRENATTSGVTLVVDAGYETTDISLFEGMKFQRDSAHTIPRAGMGIIARALEDHAKQSVRGTDISKIDRAMRPLADKAPDAEKWIEVAPDVSVNATQVYDDGIMELAALIAQETLTRVPDTVSRVLLAGGGALHLRRALIEQLEPLTVSVAPDADLSNVFGAFTALKLQANRNKGE